MRNLQRQLATPTIAATFAIPGALSSQTVSFGGTTLKTNFGMGTGSVVMDGPRLRMMDGEYSTARSAISTNTFNLATAWTTSYRVTFSCDNVGNSPGANGPICPGDGIGFVATGGADTQVGGGGFDLGYGSSFSNSVTFGLKSFWNIADFGTDGAWMKDCCSDPKLFTPPDDFLDDFDVLLSYDGLSQLTASVTRVSTSTNVFNGALTWAAPSWASSARIGFTSASGSASEYSWVSGWQIGAVTTVPEPTTVALMTVGLFGLGVVRRRRRLLEAHAE